MDFAAYAWLPSSLSLISSSLIIQIFILRVGNTTAQLRFHHQSWDSLRQLSQPRNRGSKPNKGKPYTTGTSDTNFVIEPEPVLKSQCKDIDFQRCGVEGSTGAHGGVD